MASMVLSLLSSAWFPLDLSAHQDALMLAGNLLAGVHTHYTVTIMEFWFVLQMIIDWHSCGLIFIAVSVCDLSPF